MKVIQKHKFEAVSLLTTQSGLLDVTVIPVVGKPDWLIPTSLILSVESFSDRIWNYIWNDQDISVYHLLPKEVPVDKMIILEGNTSVHRIALQTSGELNTLQLKISDVNDINLPEEFIDAGTDSYSLIDDDISVPFLYQTVEVFKEVYVVPDIDTLAYHLVDLDG